LFAQQIESTKQERLCFFVFDCAQFVS